MPTTAFEAPLDDEGLEWIRYRFTTEAGQVTTFMVQYETTVAGERKTVVRFDNAHGFAHRDLLDHRGRQVGKIVRPLGLTPSQALNLGRQEIRENWRRYRADFFGDVR